MLAYLWFTKRRPPTDIGDLLGLVFVAFSNVIIPFVLITGAEQRIDSSVATVLNSAVPLFSLIIAHFALADERLTRPKVAGLLVGYIGIIVLAWRGLADTENSPLAGQAMMLGGTISYAIAVIFMRARLRHIEPIIIACTSVVIGAIVTVPLALVTEGMPDWARVSTESFAAIFTLGLVNTVFAYFLFYSLIGNWGARATMVAYTFPPVGIALGALVLGEAVDIRLILGAVLILGGILVVNMKPRTRQPA